MSLPRSSTPRRLAVASALMVGAAMVVTAQPAAAAPTGCSYWYVGRGAVRATCTGGTGTVNAWGTCNDWDSGDSWNVNGPAVPPGQISEATCPVGPLRGLSEGGYHLND
jgi:hypothetical protein